MTLVLVLIYAAAAAAAGSLALRALAGADWPDLLHGRAPLLATALLLGQALLAALWTAAGLGGRLSPPVVWGSVALLLALGGPWLAPVLRRGLGAARSTIRELSKLPPWLRAFALLLTLMVAGLGMAAWLKAPIGDGEAFYMTYAKVIADSERLAPLPGLYSAFSTIGLLGELHFAALMPAGGAGAGKLFVWVMALSAASVIAALCRAAGVGSAGRLIAVAMLCTTTAFTHHISDGKVDLVAAALGVCAAYWALTAERGTRRLVLPLAGLLTGFAAVAKFSYIPGFVPAIVLLVAWRQLDAAAPGARLRTVASALAVCGLWAALATVPHLAKNAVMFGAPLAPFVGGPQHKDWLQQVWFTPDVTARILLTYPFALAFGRYPMQGGNVSFLVLAFLPLALWLPRPERLRDSLLLRLCAAGALATLCWMALRPSVIAPRYLLASLLLFIPLAARAAEHALEREASPRWIGAGIVAALMAALAIFSYPLLGLPKAAWLSAQDGLPACALASAHCEPLQKLNALARPGDRVFMLGYYGYWLRPDLLQCRDSYADDKMLVRLDGPGLTWTALVDGGFRYVVVDHADYSDEFERLMASPQPDGLRVTRLIDAGQLSILEIASRGDGAAPRAACRQSDPPSWEVVGTR